MVSSYGVIEGGVVVNAVLSEADFAADQGWVLLPEGVGPTWLYDGSAFTAPPEPPLPVPESMTFAQLMIGLVTEVWITEAEGEAWLVGTLPAVFLALIAALPTGEQFAAKAHAIRPSAVLRMDPLVVALGAAQGKTPEQIDDFFRTYSGV